MYVSTHVLPSFFNIVAEKPFSIQECFNVCMYRIGRCGRPIENLKKRDVKWG